MLRESARFHPARLSLTVVYSRGLAAYEGAVGGSEKDC